MKYERRAGKTSAAILAAILCCFVLSLSALAQSESVADAHGQNLASNDSSIERPTFFRRFLMPMPKPGEQGFSESELKKRPGLYFQVWASVPPLPIPLFVFLSVSNVIFFCFLRKKMPPVIQMMKERFWRSLFTGTGITILSLTCARLLFATEINAPLAMLIIALLEAGILFGIAVASLAIGESLVRLFATGSDQPSLKMGLTYLTVGTILVCLICLLPGIRAMPPIGIRLGLMLGLLGMGAAVRTLRR